MNKFLKNIDIPIIGCLSSYLVWSFVRWEFWYPGWLEAPERALFLLCFLFSTVVYIISTRG